MATDAKGKTTTTKGKRETKKTGAKTKAKTTGLKEFLANLATDPRKLGEFLHAPEDAMSTANLSEEDQTALRSGVAGMVAARLAGVPLDQAFQLFPMSWPQKMAFQPMFAMWPQKLVADFPLFGTWPQKLAADLPLFVMFKKAAAESARQEATPESAYPYMMYTPQFVVQPPPQYVVYPPQFVVQPPPQYVVYPPQFVVQPPPQYVVYPPYYPR
jgi:hypothetical protein